MIKNNLKNIRKEKKITQTKLADSVLTTRQTIYLIEKNKVLPSLELAFRLADYFSLKIEDIFLFKKKEKEIREDLFDLF